MKIQYCLTGFDIFLVCLDSRDEMGDALDDALRVLASIGFDPLGDLVAVVAEVPGGAGVDLFECFAHFGACLAGGGVCVEESMCCGMRVVWGVCKGGI